jgi:hypothetical protein
MHGRERKIVATAQVRADMAVICKSLSVAPGHSYGTARWLPGSLEKELALAGGRRSTDEFPDG